MSKIRTMYVMTHHGTLLAHDALHGALLQLGPLDGATSNNTIELTFSYISELKNNNGTETISFGPLAGYKYIQGADPRSFHLAKDGHFACAEPNVNIIAFDRALADFWETFWLVEHDQEGLFKTSISQFNQEGQPVCLHFGCADRRISGFFNIDIHPYDPPDLRPWQRPETNAKIDGDFSRYFFFDYTEKPWPIPACSVDYIYSEDFVEHIPQKYQIGFFAEALRVLKPGGINRVNTPCLNETMRRHSDFRQGYSGVYFAEYDDWGHVCLFTRGSLQEMAAMVGYRQIFFTARNQGTSQYAVSDTRPGADRDELTGNIIADLVK